MKLNTFKGFDAYLAHVKSRPNVDVSASVQAILQTVQEGGDTAVRHYTEKFDRVQLKDFRVSMEQIQQAFRQLDPETETIFKDASDNIRRFHRRQKAESQLRFENDGSLLGWKVTPIDAVGIYVPGGTAPLFSSLLMNVIPAQIAGVPRIAIMSPPGPDGIPHPLIVATAALLGLTEIYAIGGAQAIGALAYGTESIDPVYKITGPGNAYVAEAKRQVYGIVGIESVAGPSDITILCDQPNLSTEFLVRDMLSQAEHDTDARALLVTTSASQATAVEQRLQELVPTLPRREILERSLQEQSAIIVVDDLEAAFDAVNAIAPEHLELLTQQPMEDLHRIRNAGAIFLGPNTPEPVGDYFAGPNHTLPTEGRAKFSSPLGVQDFQKTTSIIRYSEQRLQREGEAIAHFAKLESLDAHAAAVQVRLDNTK